MGNGREEIEWGRRVSQAQLRRLYESDAQGRLDEELLDEVGYTLLQRCRDILKVDDAQRGRVHCARCAQAGRQTLLQRPPASGDPRDVLLTCSICGWQITWGAYHLSYKRKQLNPGGATQSFANFVKNYPLARAPEVKMIAIDRLIHEFHYSYKALPDLPTRPVGVNLIEGKLEDVIAFLDALNAGDQRAWKENVERSRTAAGEIHAYRRHNQHQAKKA